MHASLLQLSTLRVWESLDGSSTTAEPHPWRVQELVNIQSIGPRRELTWLGMLSAKRETNENMILLAMRILKIK